VSELVRLLSRNTGLPPNDITRIILTAPKRYKVYQIPKKSGGSREIAQPSREVKLLQRAMLQTVLADLPIHPAAKAYRLGHSVLHNAAPHAGSTPILKMDFREFFPSIRSSDWVEYCIRQNLFTEEDRRLSALVLFRKAKTEHLLKLSIGAPTSPQISNLLLFDFDTKMTGEAERRNITYTRYADDLTFSGQRIGMLKDMLDATDHVLRSLPFPRLTVNKDKTTFVTTARRRVVTGITLANDGTTGLGRDKKRLISAQVHRASKGLLKPDELASLCGHLAFVNVVEPTFLGWLRSKYGDSTVDRIKRSIGRGSPIGTVPRY
jgi:RNA-directed DNA polymerase